MKLENMEKKEALSRIKAWNLDADDMEVLSALIPELKESDDERIRKEIIQYIKTGTYHKNWISWLEKQGEKEYDLKSLKDVDVHKFVQYIERQAKAYEFNLPNRSYDIYGFAKDILSWLENQNEQNPAPFKAEHGKYYYCIKNYFSGGKKWASKGDVVQALRGLPIMGLDDASEFFLPVNNMQYLPKFKVGDWITDNKNTFQIVGNENNWYCADDGDKIRFDIVHKFYHLWTIEDAKAGDVLYTVSTASNETFIFKGLTTEGNIVCYCSYDSEDKYCEGTHHFIGKPTSMTHPATKEQRDKLEKAITKAGYKWDAEKMELKKI